MARNRTIQIPVWRASVAPDTYTPSYLERTFESLRSTIENLARTLEVGPVPGQTVSFDFGPLTFDNSGGGAPSAQLIRIPQIEAHIEPRFVSAVATSIAGTACTIQINHGVPGGAGTAMLNTVLTLAVATPSAALYDSAADFAVTEIPRQHAFAAILTIPAGAVATHVVVRLVCSRPGRIPDVGVTGSLGR